MTEGAASMDAFPLRPPLGATSPTAQTAAGEAWDCGFLARFLLQSDGFCGIVITVYFQMVSLTGRFKLKKIKAAESGFFLPQHFRRKYITGEARFTRRKAYFTDLHSKSASLPIGHLLPFCYKQIFPYPENPANCTNFSKAETFLLASGFYRAIMGFVAFKANKF